MIYALKTWILILLLSFTMGCVYTKDFESGLEESSETLQKTHVDNMLVTEDYKPNRPESYGFKEKGWRWTPPPDPDRSFGEMTPGTIRATP